MQNHKGLANDELHTEGASIYWQRSRSLTQLSRQITPPTKNGHAPPSKKSCKSSQSGNPYLVLTW